ncbi:Hypothetical predicted protein [Olea europaea subsp. europaea]|uniref:Uncharacterized protein n=1 Tax=Olea europaea subsp. europaea TaxID=158383 RepID=A0A8S0TM99_OLEEU|nr:Hypothetical predicted protein [Olea europaea subsp. europaea]
MRGAGTRGLRNSKTHDAGPQRKSIEFESTDCGALVHPPREGAKIQVIWSFRDSVEIESPGRVKNHRGAKRALRIALADGPPPRESSALMQRALLKAGHTMAHPSHRRHLAGRRTVWSDQRERACRAAAAQGQRRLFSFLKTNSRLHNSAATSSSLSLRMFYDDLDLPSRTRRHDHPDRLAG